MIHGMQMTVIYHVNHRELDNTHHHWPTKVQTYGTLLYPTALRRVQISRPKRVQISRGICTPEDRLDRFSRNAQATNWIEVTKTMADVNFNYFSDDKESEWLANIGPSLLGKSNKEKQLDDSEISSFFEENRNSNTTKKTKTDLMFGLAGATS